MEKIVINAWVSRDEDGNVRVFGGKPIRVKSCNPGRNYWLPFKFCESWCLGKEAFPDVTWEGEPKKVKIEISCDEWEG